MSVGGSVAEVLSEPVSVPATASEWEVDPEGAIFPRVEIVTVLTSQGVRAVRVALVEPTGLDGDGWAAAMFTATGIRQLIAVLEKNLVMTEDVAPAALPLRGCHVSKVAGR